MGVEKEAVLPWQNDVATAAFGISNYRTTGSESFDGGDAERFKAGKKIGTRSLEIASKRSGVKPRDKRNQRRAFCKLDEASMFGTIADNGKRATGSETGFDG